MSMASNTQAKPRGLGYWFSRFLDIPFVYPLSAILLVLVMIERPMMLKPIFFFTIMRQAVPLVLVTVGQSLCMRIRSIDLSTPGVIVAAVYLLTGGWIDAPSWVLCSLAVLIGALSGAVNGWFIGVRRSSAVLVTLATSMILTGIVLVLSGIRQPDRGPADLVALAKWRIEGIPVIVIIAFVFVAIFAMLLRRSVLNRIIDAIGTNPKAAWVSGLPYLKIVFAVHVLSGVFASLAAIVLVASLGKGSVILGADLALYSLASVVLGGVSFGVARGGVLGPVLAAAMLIYLFNFLTAYNLAQPVRLTVVGVVIVVSAILISAKHNSR